MKKYVWILVLSILSAHLMAADRYAPPAFGDLLNYLSRVTASDDMDEVLKTIQTGGKFGHYDEALPVSMDPRDGWTLYAKQKIQDAYVNAIAWVLIKKPGLQDSSRSDVENAAVFGIPRGSMPDLARAAHLGVILDFYEKAKMQAEQMRQTAEQIRRADAATKIQSIVRGRQVRKEVQAQKPKRWALMVLPQRPETSGPDQQERMRQELVAKAHQRGFAVVGDEFVQRSPSPQRASSLVRGPRDNAELIKRYEKEKADFMEQTGGSTADFRKAFAKKYPNMVDWMGRNRAELDDEAAESPHKTPPRARSQSEPDSPGSPDARDPNARPQENILRRIGNWWGSKTSKTPQQGSASEKSHSPAAGGT